MEFVAIERRAVGLNMTSRMSVCLRSGVVDDLQRDGFGNSPGAKTNGLLAST